MMTDTKRKMTIEFWGIRGSFPVPGHNAIVYGGNTNCITLRFSDKHDFFIFDAGTGSKALSDFILKENKFPISAKIFFSHPHIDHIDGLPFFAPFYMVGNEFDIYAAPHCSDNIEELIFHYMNKVYFPVTVEEFRAKIRYHELGEGSFFIDDIQIKTILLNHPGKSLGYRIEFNNKSFCYITDNELYLNNHPSYHVEEVNHLIDFIRNTDVLVIDSTYTDKQYLEKINWGHSSISQVIDVADKAKVKLLCLHHHDPSQTDTDITSKLEMANALLEQRHSKTRCIAPHEGEKIVL